MTADLNPDLRDKAAAALCDMYLDEILTLPPGLPGIRFHEVTQEGRDVYRRLVDAVTAVVLPAALDLEERAHARTSAEASRLQAENERMREELADLRDSLIVVECTDPEHAERDQLKARVEVLTEALRGLNAAVTGDIDAIPEAQCRARAALAAGEEKP